MMQRKLQPDPEGSRYFMSALCPLLHRKCRGGDYISLRDGGNLILSVNDTDEVIEFEIHIKLIAIVFTISQVQNSGFSTAFSLQPPSPSPRNSPRPMSVHKCVLRPRYHPSSKQSAKAVQAPTVKRRANSLRAGNHRNSWAGETPVPNSPVRVIYDQEGVPLAVTYHGPKPSTVSAHVLVWAVSRVVVVLVEVRHP